MKERWQLELDRAAARDAWEPRLHARHGEPFVDWALWLLEQGVTDESVQILAVLRGPLSRWEVESSLRRVLFALGLEAPNPERFPYEQTCDLARRTIAGELSPQAGLAAIYREWKRLDYDPALKICYVMEEKLEPTDSLEAILPELQVLLATLSEPSRGER
ncbi:hypothetical protein [Armatimonas rosea]|uniref:Uncharacterized protein n=1 Tax=Armatimonas rosea TaxID=685828 RepID=A0A7W9SRD3_ARMRO|nr:hypothetical protein [Armatimonas rosea]MBB6051366.1 hypothetical protein [Armatimonas rosea]